jgi:hypothetical protein
MRVRLRKTSAPDGLPANQAQVYLSSAGVIRVAKGDGTDISLEGGSGPTLSDATPADLGTADAGASDEASRADHVHAMPTASDVGADPAGTASAAVTAHAAATDPHGDRAYASGLVTTEASSRSSGDATNAAAITAEASARAAADALLVPTSAAFAVAPLASLTLTSAYELIGPHIVRKVVATGFDADPPTNWTLTNGSKLTSHSVSSGVLTMQHDGTSADGYGSGTKTAPYYLHTLTPRPTGVLEIVCRVQMTANGGDGDAVRWYLGSAEGGDSLGFDILRVSSSSFSLRVWQSSTASTILSGQTSTQAATGWWTRLLVYPNGDYTAHYATGSGSEPADSAWTFAKSGNSAQLATAAAGTWVLTPVVTRAAGTGATGTFWPTRLRVLGGVPGVSGYTPGALLYTANSALTTHSDAYVGGTSDARLNACVQAMLANALNRLPNDSATWEVTVQRRTAAGSYGAASWTGTGAVACTGSGEFVQIQIRATGTGTQGSALYAALAFTVSP